MTGRGRDFRVKSRGTEDVPLCLHCAHPKRHHNDLRLASRHGHCSFKNQLTGDPCMGCPGYEPSDVPEGDYWARADT